LHSFERSTIDKGADKTMTSRERVLAALNHQSPERVPVDFSGHRSSGIMAIAYARLKKHLGITEGDIYVYDILQQLAVVEPPVLDRFGVDVIELGRGFALDESYWTDWELPDGTPCKVPAYVNLRRDGGDWFIDADDGAPLAVQKQGSLYFEQINFPLAESDDCEFTDLSSAFDRAMWAAVGSPPAPLGFDDASLAELRRGARALRDATDRAIVGLFGGNLNETGQFLFRMDKFLLLLAQEPKRVHRFLDKVVELHLENLEKYLAAVGDCIDVILFGDDLGMQSGPQFSPRMYDEFFKERHAALWQRAKKLADVKVMLHCCGGVYELMPSLIEAGLDAINPVQISAAGMEPRRLKQEFGRDIVFWGGGCDTARVLPRGTPEEVRDHVREMVGILSPQGGFVFQQVHNIMADVPPENIVAMFDAVNDAEAIREPHR